MATPAIETRRKCHVICTFELGRQPILHLSIFVQSSQGSTRRSLLGVWGPSGICQPPDGGTADTRNRGLANSLARPIAGSIMLPTIGIKNLVASSSRLSSSSSLSRRRFVSATTTESSSRTRYPHAIGSLRSHILLGHRINCRTEIRTT
jgi:hypothetical protein